MGGDRWRDLHEGRAAGVGVLREAGYYPRWRWARSLWGRRQVGRHEVDDWVYTEGPCEGLPAVDPWVIADRLSACGAAWVVQLRNSTRRDPDVLPLPVLCNQRHVCNVCAGLRSERLARALRRCIEVDIDADAVEAVALATLTQRARRGEALAEAIGRLLRAWSLMTRGRPGKRWRAVVAAAFRGLEVTWNNVNGWWHAHLHVVIGTAGGVDHDDARRVVMDLWEAATRSASGDFGWDRVAGVQVPGERYADASARVYSGRPGSTAGGWWREIDPSDPASVYQACKYPTPISELPPRQLAEFLSVAHGRRWHQGSGLWFSAMKRAQRGGDAELLFSGTDIGTGATDCSPHLAPRLDDVDPCIGLEAPPEDDGSDGEHIVVMSNSVAGWQLGLKLYCSYHKLRVEADGRVGVTFSRLELRSLMRATLARLAEGRASTERGPPRTLAGTVP